MTNKKSPIEDRIAGLYRQQKAPVPESIWQNIEISLNAKQKKRRRSIWLFISMMTLFMILGTLAVLPLLRKTHKADIADRDSAFEYRHDKIANDASEITDTSSQSTEQAIASSRRISMPETILKTDGTTSLIRNQRSSAKPVESNMTVKVTSQSNERNTTPSDKIAAVDESATRLPISAFEGGVHIERSVPQQIPGQLTLMEGRDIYPTWIGPNREMMSLPWQNQHEKNAGIIRQHRLRPFIGVSAGIGLPFRKMVNHSVESELYVGRQSTEHPLYLTNIQADAGLLLDDSWSIKSGIEWQQAVEQFSYKKFDATRLEYKTDDITGRIDDTSLVRGLLTEQFGNKYTMLNIPLYLGYEKRFGRWVFGIEGGVGFNIHFRTSGKVLVDDQKIQSLDNRHDIYASSTGISWRVGASCLRSIAPGTMVYARLMCMAYPDSWTLSTHPNEIRYRFLTANVGLRKVF